MAPAGNPSDNEIVRTWQDESCGTGDLIYRTGDGRTWRTSRSAAPITGEVIGAVRANRIEPRPTR